MGLFSFTFPISREPLNECSIGVDECELILWIWPIITASIWLFIYVPIIIYHAIKYYKHSNHIVYTNRYSDIVIIEVKTFFIQLIFAINNIFSIWYVDQVQPLYIIYLSMETLISIYLYYLWVWRYYLIYYDLNFITECQNNQWMAIINPALFHEDRSKRTHTEKDEIFDYFLSNRNTLGNKKFLYKNVILPTVIVSSLVFCLTQLLISFTYQKEAGEFGDDSAFAKAYSIVLTLKVIPFIILSIIYYKMPSFEDEFYIKWELQRLFLCLLLQITCIYAATLMQIWTQENLLWNAIIGPCITYNMIIFWHTMATYICTGWVNKKVKHILQSKNYAVIQVKLATMTDHDHNIQYLRYKTNDDSKRNTMSQHQEREDSVQQRADMNLFAVPASRVRSVSLQKFKLNKNDDIKDPHKQLLLPTDNGCINKSDDYNDSEIKLVEIIGHEKAFTSFMTHLSTEFSMEILLSIYEFIQYKDLIKQYIKKHDIELDDDDDDDGDNSYHSEHSRNSRNSRNSKHSKDSMNDEDLGSNLSGFNSNRSSIYSIIDERTFAKNPILSEIKLPPSYPKSFIVYNYNDDVLGDVDILQLTQNKFIIHCKKVVHEIYNKYVAVGSSWEINLSFYVRKKIIHIAHDKEKLLQNKRIGLKQLLYIYDECIDGVVSVMTDSYDRFRRTHQYRKLKNLMFVKN